MENPQCRTHSIKNINQTQLIESAAIEVIVSLNEVFILQGPFSPGSSSDTETPSSHDSIAIISKGILQVLSTDALINDPFNFDFSGKSI